MIYIQERLKNAPRKRVALKSRRPELVNSSPPCASQSATCLQAGLNLRHPDAVEVWSHAVIIVCVGPLLEVEQSDYDVLEGLVCRNITSTVFSTVL